MQFNPIAAFVVVATAEGFVITDSAGIEPGLALVMRDAIWSQGRKLNDSLEPEGGAEVVDLSKARRTRR